MDLSLNVVIHLESCGYVKRQNVLLLQFIIFCSQLTLNFSQKKEMHRKHNSATDVRKRGEGRRRDGCGQQLAVSLLFLLSGSRCIKPFPDLCYLYLCSSPCSSSSVPEGLSLNGLVWIILWIVSSIPPAHSDDPRFISLDPAFQHWAEFVKL